MALSGSPHNSVYVAAEALVAEVLRFVSRLGLDGRTSLRGHVGAPAAAREPVEAASS